MYDKFCALGGARSVLGAMSGPGPKGPKNSPCKNNSINNKKKNKNKNNSKDKRKNNNKKKQEQEQDQEQEQQQQ